MINSDAVDVAIGVNVGIDMRDQMLLESGIGSQALCFFKRLAERLGEALERKNRLGNAVVDA